MASGGGGLPSDGRLARGERTRRAILDHAVRMASTQGFDGLSIGKLARDLNLSKSGLFAHFRSKQSLQLQVMAAAEQRFIDFVVRPAIEAPRGEPRLRALLHRWCRWALSEGPPGGCVFVAAAAELDDRPGPLRDALARTQRDWLHTLQRAVGIAQQEGHLRADLEAEQLAFELYSTLLGVHLYHRLLDHHDARARLDTALERILAAAR